MIIYVLWPEGFLVRSKNSFGQNDETQTPQIPTVVERVSDFRSKLLFILFTLHIILIGTWILALPGTLQNLR